MITAVEYTTMLIEKYCTKNNITCNIELNNNEFWTLSYLLDRNNQDFTKLILIIDIELNMIHEILSADKIMNTNYKKHTDLKYIPIRELHRNEILSELLND
jgi:hypothetical protein